MSIDPDDRLQWHEVKRLIDGMPEIGRTWAWARQALRLAYLDHADFSSREVASESIWRVMRISMTPHDLDRFMAAYEVGFQHPSELMRTMGFLRALFREPVDLSNLGSPSVADGGFEGE